MKIEELVLVAMTVREDANSTCISRVFNKTDLHFSVLTRLTRENEGVARTLY